MLRLMQKAVLLNTIVKAKEKRILGIIQCIDDDLS